MTKTKSKLMNELIEFTGLGDFPAIESQLRFLASRLTKDEMTTVAKLVDLTLQYSHATTQLPTSRAWDVVANAVNWWKTVEGKTPVVVRYKKDAADRPVTGRLVGAGGTRGRRYIIFETEDGSVRAAYLAEISAIGGLVPPTDWKYEIPPEATKRS